MERTDGNGISGNISVCRKSWKSPDWTNRNKTGIVSHSSKSARLKKPVFLTGKTKNWNRRIAGCWTESGSPRDCGSYRYTSEDSSSNASDLLSRADPCVAGRRGVTGQGGQLYAQLSEIDDLLNDFNRELSSMRKHLNFPMKNFTKRKAD